MRLYCANVRQRRVGSLSGMTDGEGVRLHINSSGRVRNDAAVPISYDPRGLVRSSHQPDTASTTSPTRFVRVWPKAVGMTWFRSEMAMRFNDMLSGTVSVPIRTLRGSFGVMQMYEIACRRHPDTSFGVRGIA